MHSFYTPSKNISNYDQLNEYILDGWNTWDNRSILTHVLLPEGLALTIQIQDTLREDSLIYAFTGNRVKGSEQVRTIAHTADGSYTDFILNWREFGMRVQSTSEGDDLHLLITPDENKQNPGFLKLKAEILYDSNGSISFVGSFLHP